MIFVKNCLNKFKSLIIILSALFFALNFLCACSCKNIESSPIPSLKLPSPTAVVPTPQPTPEPTTVPEVENTIVTSRAMVLACDKLSFALASNGQLSYVGSNEGQAYCYDWNEIVKITAGNDFTAGLKSDGTVCISGAKEIENAVAAWTDVTDITASDDNLYALTASGKILSTDTDSSLKSIMGVIDFSAGKDFLVCLLCDGNLVGVGNVPDLSALSEQKIDAVACGDDFVCALTETGKVVSTMFSDLFDLLENIRDLFVGTDCIAAIDENNVVYTNCGFVSPNDDNLNLYVENDVIGFSSADNHALFLKSDGSVEAVGDNSYLQCKTANWQLLPYLTDDGYVLGLTVGQLNADGNIVKTGDEITLADGISGIAAILGDIDMNGVIDENDYQMLERFLKSKISLTDLQLRAANVYFDSSNPDSVDMADLELLRYHLNGWTQIDQYAKDFRYSVKLAEYENINTDVMGYIKIQNTNIEGPLMYGDNFYYHSHNYAKTPTSRGSLYLYYDSPTQNNVITGHNLRVAGIMLNQLHLIQDKYAKTYDKFENRVWYINLYGETHLWEVFSMYEEKPKSPSQSSQYYNCNYDQTMDAMTDEEILQWIEYQQQRTELNYQIHVTEKDYFVTVLTCADQHWESNQGGRIYFFLRRVDGH